VLSGSPDPPRIGTFYADLFECGFFIHPVLAGWGAVMVTMLEEPSSISYTFMEDVGIRPGMREQFHAMKTLSKIVHAAHHGQRERAEQRLLELLISCRRLIRQQTQSPSALS